MSKPTLRWSQTKPNLWLSHDGAYAIVATTLPEERERPSVTYTLRHRDPDMNAAYPGQLGYFVEERYHLSEAQGAAETHKYCYEHAAERRVPESYPAHTKQEFWWPISEGITKGVLLARIDDAGRPVAQIVSMSRGGQEDPTGEYPFRPYVHTELDLSGLLAECEKSVPAAG